MQMGIVFWTIMMGFVCGALLEYFSANRNGGDLFAAMTVGLIGSVLFGWLGAFLKVYRYGEIQGLVASFIGASALLFFYQSYKNSKSTNRPNF